MQLNFTEPLRTTIIASQNEYVNSAKLVCEALGLSSIILDKQSTVLFAYINTHQQTTAMSGELIGKKLSELAELILPTNVNIEHIISTHDEIIRTNQRRIYLEIHKNNNIVDAYISHKTPIYDTENNFLCLHIQYKPFTVARLANLGAKFHHVNGYPLNRTEFAKYELTRIQQMVIYLYARNYSYTEVSTWLARFGISISPAMVNKQLLKLKNIFNVSDNEQLKDMSLKLGYDVAVPVEFLPEGVHDITEDVFDLWIC